MATYLIINLLVIAGILPALLMYRRLPSKAWLITLTALLVLTALFDNVIIALGIVGYDRREMLGVFIGKAPVEDFCYALVAAILVPLLWRRRDG